MPLPKHRQKQPFIGDRAYQEITARLLANPVAQQLSREAYDFYGHFLSYIESRDFDSTAFAIHLHHEPVVLKSVEIQLQLGTDRVAEALSHELLHLRLPMLGFPLGELVEIPLPLDHYAREFLGMSHWVMNLVHHEINFGSFMAMGFDKKHFLAKHVKPMDYCERLKPNRRNGHCREIDFPRWCIEYLRYLFTARHGGNEDFEGYAQDVLDCGSRLYPDLKPTAAKMQRWFEKGAFRDPCQYPRQVNWLLGLMGIPKFTGWVILEVSGTQKPKAVRLAQDYDFVQLLAWESSLDFACYESMPGNFII